MRFPFDSRISPRAAGPEDEEDGGGVGDEVVVAEDWLDEADWLGEVEPDPDALPLGLVCCAPDVCDIPFPESSRTDASETTRKTRTHRADRRWRIFNASGLTGRLSFA